MFTGAVEDIGDLVKSSGSRFTFSVPERFLGTMEIGGSISINGACLTAVNLENKRGRLSVDVSPETRSKTNIGNLKPGDKVNLELPLGTGEFSDKLDGHLVQGHVDTLGKIGKIKKKRNNYLYRISTPRKFSSYLVDKGAVALDGISLTPYRVTGGAFTVSVIPHTYENTTLQFKRSGSEVNVEFDILAKYIRNNVNKTNLYRE
ncbi:riboflavin synthase [Candidatus Bipolaricaulota bacterium]|nr:riboflavin synthase [Candidatus Bipolaricaulota bacterium]